MLNISMISDSSDAKIQMFGLFLQLKFSSENQTLYLKLFETMATSGLRKNSNSILMFYDANERNCTKIKELKKTVLRPRWCLSDA